MNPYRALKSRPAVCPQQHVYASRPRRMSLAQSSVPTVMAASPSKIPRLRRASKASNPTATVKILKHGLTNNNSNANQINGPGTITNNNSVTNHIDARPPAPPAPLVRSEIHLLVVIYLIGLQ